MSLQDREPLLATLQKTIIYIQGNLKRDKSSSSRGCNDIWILLCKVCNAAFTQPITLSSSHLDQQQNHWHHQAWKKKNSAQGLAGAHLQQLVLPFPAESWAVCPHTGGHCLKGRLWVGEGCCQSPTVIYSCAAGWSRSRDNWCSAAVVAAAPRCPLWGRKWTLCLCLPHSRLGRPGCKSSLHTLSGHSSPGKQKERLRVEKQPSSFVHHFNGLSCYLIWRKDGKSVG